MNKTTSFLVAVIVLISASILTFSGYLPSGEIVSETPEPTETPTNEIELPNKNLPPTYPAYPTLADCEKTSKKDFCMGDVAEIKNDIGICGKIYDPDIKTFCIARISMDDAMCKEIIDPALSEACLESISIRR